MENVVGVYYVSCPTFVSLSPFFSICPIPCIQCWLPIRALHLWQAHLIPYTALAIIYSANEDILCSGTGGQQYVWGVAIAVHP